MKKKLPKISQYHEKTSMGLFEYNFYVWDISIWKRKIFRFQISCTLYAKCFVHMIVVMSSDYRGDFQILATFHFDLFKSSPLKSPQRQPLLLQKPVRPESCYNKGEECTCATSNKIPIKI